MTQDTERLMKLVNKGIKVFHKANPNNKRDYLGKVWTDGNNCYYGSEGNRAGSVEADVIDLSHMLANLALILCDVCDLYLKEEN
jgi:hypothetical protein